MTRTIFSAMLAASLIGNSQANTVNSLGTITDAQSAHVSEGSASPGTTVYDGDRLKTDEGGGLAIKTKNMSLRLEAETRVTLQRPANSESIAVELAQGTIVFSTAQAPAVEIRANGTVIRPAANTSTIAYVRLVGSRELRVYARRGALEFSYGEEREQIAEEGCYRVVVGAVEEDARANEDDAGRIADASPPTKKASNARKPFVMIAIAIGVGVAAGLRHHPHRHPHESPEEP